MYIADTANQRVRRVIVAPLPTPTVPGSNVPLHLGATLLDSSPAPVAMTFDSIAASGQTSVSTSNQGLPTPYGFKLGEPPVYYDVSTTATFSGSVKLCFTWKQGQFYNETTIRLMHYESGAWRDVTTSLDTTNNIVCGMVTSLSPFALLERAYAFAGFLSPVDNLPVLNALSAGQAVPREVQSGRQSRP